MPPSKGTATLPVLNKGTQSNFFSSFFFLPVAQRRAMNVIYAFCRHVDDVVDTKQERALEELQWWHREMKKVCEGKASDGLCAEFVAVIRDYHIPFDYFEELLLGVEMDLNKSRYETFDELYEYCYRVASVVGLISLKIFGTARQESHFYAINLGIALQLTNILRDVGEDYSRGRIYLPIEDLKRFGYTERDLHHRTYSQAFIRLMDFQVERAKQFYRRAEGYSFTSDWKKLAAAQIMGATYYALLEEIMDNDYAVFENEIRLNRWQKTMIAWNTFLKNRCAWIAGVGRK